MPEFKQLSKEEVDKLLNPSLQYKEKIMKMDKPQRFIWNRFISQLKEIKETKLIASDKVTALFFCLLDSNGQPVAVEALKAYISQETDGKTISDPTFSRLLQSVRSILGEVFDLDSKLTKEIISRQRRSQTHLGEGEFPREASITFNLDLLVTELKRRKAIEQERKMAQKVYEQREKEGVKETDSSSLFSLEEELRTQALEEVLKKFGSAERGFIGQLLKVMQPGEILAFVEVVEKLAEKGLFYSQEKIQELIRGWRQKTKNVVFQKGDKVMILDFSGYIDPVAVQSSLRDSEQPRFFIRLNPQALKIRELK